MTQAQPQFQRPLLMIGSILFIAGMVIAIVSTAIHYFIHLQNMPAMIHG